MLPSPYCTSSPFGSSLILLLWKVMLKSVVQVKSLVTMFCELRETSRPLLPNFPKLDVLLPKPVTHEIGVANSMSLVTLL